MSERRTSDQLAAFVTEVRYEALPPSILEAARRILLDDLGSILGGFREPEAAALAQAVAGHNAGGASTVLGVGFARVAPAAAVLANGTANCGLETDGGYRYASCHASSYVLPTALALAEATAADGRRLSEALVAGYEVASRLAAATTLRRPMLGHGVWSAPGAAAAAARLLGLDRTQTAVAIDLAATLTGNAAFTGRVEGATVRNTYNGVGGRAGLLAATLARGGATTGFDAVARLSGDLSGSDFDALRVVEGVGGGHAIGFHYHKRWACCGFIHASLDAIAELMAEEPIDPAAIETIEIATFPEGAVLSDRAPRRPLAARHSVPWAAAALIVRGKLLPDSFAADALDDPVIRALSSLVDVHEDDTLPSGFSNHRSARVRVRYRDGRERTRTCENVQGDFSTPFPESLLLDKFAFLAEPVLGPATARIAETILAVDGLADVRTLTTAIAQAGAATQAERRERAEHSQRRADVPAYLRALCASALARPAASALEAAGTTMSRTAAAIERGKRALVAVDIMDKDGRVRLQGGGPEARALSAGLAAAMAGDEPPDRIAICAAAAASGATAKAGEDRIAAAVAGGLDLVARLARATTLRPGYADAGIWGVLGAAAASALVKGFDAEAIAQALNVAASLTLATPADGGTPWLSAAQAGEAAYRGVLATSLVDAGYDGLRDGLGFILDEFVAQAFDRTATHPATSI